MKYVIHLANNPPFRVGDVINFNGMDAVVTSTKADEFKITTTKLTGWRIWDRPLVWFYRYVARYL